MDPDELLKTLDPDEAELMGRYFALPAAKRTEKLDDIADRVGRYGYFNSPRQMAFFRYRLAEVERGAAVQAHEPVEELEVRPPETDDFPW